MFDRPFLIYDDRCYSCGKFAKWTSILSRGWIRTGGHHTSEEVTNLKKFIFPSNYDSTKMFWIINHNGAYGARSALLPLVKEILIGFFNPMNNDDDFKLICDYKTMTCNSSINTLKRLYNLLKNADKFYFKT